MSRYPVKRNQRAPREVEPDAVEVIRPASSFFSFHYSHTEISVGEGKAHVRARRTRLEEGKLTQETFEGDVDRTVYDRMVDDAQHYFLEQTKLFAKSLSWLLPSLRNPRSDRD